MKAMTEKAHAAGAVMIWDLARSAGAVAVDVVSSNAEFAVGCTYRHLNGGEGTRALNIDGIERTRTAQTYEAF